MVIISLLVSAVLASLQIALLAIMAFNKILTNQLPSKMNVSIDGICKNSDKENMLLSEILIFSV